LNAKFFPSVLTLSLLLCACAGALDKPERFKDALARLDGSIGDAGTPNAPATGDAGNDAPPACVAAVIKTSCGVAGCHAVGGQKPDFVSDGVVKRLVDQTSASTLCKDRKYIASDGTASLLLDKLEATPPCGSKMPLVGMLSAAQRTCLDDWVVSLGGALPKAGAK